MFDFFDHKHLIEWFNAEKRELPWRIAPTPYAVWVSEVMLQQTQVSVVVPYFLRWMERFPTLEHLAKASLEEVIKLWEGLGYYSRARNLYSGARYVVEHFNGTIPDNAQDLAKIKGLGDYTIGAILSFAFHQRIPAVDGNVLRVMSRYYLIEEDISKLKTVRHIRATVIQILPSEEPWICTEALIELGAMICQKKPRCSECPLRHSCRAFLCGRTDEVPIKTVKQKAENLYRAVAIITCRDKVLIKKVGEGEIMSGLYEFPYFEVNPQGIPADEFSTLIKNKMGLSSSVHQVLPNIRHSFTRFQVRLFPVHFIGTEQTHIPGYQWVDFQSLEQLPFSSGHRRILKHILFQA